MITGRPERRDGVDHLVLTRTFQAPVEDVWAALTEPDRLARWFCTWTGDPSTGRVDVTWLFEEDTPVEPYAVEACEAPRHLRVSTLHEDPEQVWTLDARLEHEAGVTTLHFAQALIGAVPVSDVGPGWEYYLDRLEDSVRTGDVSDRQWDGYQALGSDYAEAFGVSTG